MGQALRKHHISLKNAFAGIRWAITSQPNFRVHLAISSVMVLLGFLFRIAYFEWILLIFTIIFGLSAEMINTAIEEVCDLVTTEWRKEIKIAKDVSAGMMLLVALGATVVGMLIFIPKISAVLLG